MSSSTAIVEACTPFITNEELKEATENWSETNILGRGGFGVVFKGMWKNTKVAIKREKQVIKLLGISFIYQSLRNSIHFFKFI